MPPVVTLYTRRGCCLCDDALRAIEAARRRSGFVLEIRDIDADPALQRLYTEEVPVIAIDGVKAFKYRLTESEFLKKLAART
jgi:glutaredoxin